MTREDTVQPGLQGHITPEVFVTHLRFIGQHENTFEKHRTAPISGEIHVACLLGFEPQGTWPLSQFALKQILSSDENVLPIHPSNPID